MFLMNFVFCFFLNRVCFIQKDYDSRKGSDNEKKVNLKQDFFDSIRVCYEIIYFAVRIVVSRVSDYKF